MEHAKMIIDAMSKAGKAVKAGDLVNLTGLTREEVDKALKQLKKEEKISSPKACFWEPKK